MAKQMKDPVNKIYKYFKDFQKAFEEFKSVWESTQKNAHHVLENPFGDFELQSLWHTVPLGHSQLIAAIEASGLKESNDWVLDLRYIRETQEWHGHIRLIQKVLAYPEADAYLGACHNDLLGVIDMVVHAANRNTSNPTKIPLIYIQPELSLVPGPIDFDEVMLSIEKGWDDLYSTTRVFYWSQMGADTREQLPY